MRFISAKSLLLGLLTSLAVLTGTLAPTSANASLKCEERMTARTCVDAAPRSVGIGGDVYATMTAPVIAGYPSACWNWSRKFQCIETTPQLYCDSGTNYTYVKRDCNLTSAVKKSTVKINGITYITNADYTYRCAFGEPTTSDVLPNKECVQLDSTSSYTDYTPAAPVGADPATAGMTTQIPTTQVTDEENVCYSPPVTSCSDTCFTDSVDPVTGENKRTPTACSSPINQCTSTSSYCNGVGGSSAVGPDGRCVDHTEQYMCQSGEVPKCLTKDNCLLVGTEATSIQSNGFAAGQEQTYECSNTTRTCTAYSEVSSCMHVNAWGWDNMSIVNQIGQGLGEFNQAMSRLEGIDKGLGGEDPYIFSGHDLRCSYAVGNFLNTVIMLAVAAVVIVASGGTAVGPLANALANPAIMGSAVMTGAQANLVAQSISVGLTFAQDAVNSKAFGGNCCREDAHVDGSDKPWKLRECSADEIRLSVAKAKGLAYYLGDYCSKRSGFPLRQCVQRTKSYCVFEDMLALVINEQGRAQLDEMARQDPATTTKSAPMSFNLFNTYIDPTSVPKYSDYLDNGRWMKLLSHNGSQIWFWQQPGYCLTPERQAAAFKKYEDEMEAATDTKGTEPGKMTRREAGTRLNNILGIKSFQDCSTTAGMMSWLTCSAQGDNCDTTKMPASPTDTEVEISATQTQPADPNWRVQQVRSFYEPGQYGVHDVMPSDPSFAAMSASVNEYVTATGSCKRASGACLYEFLVTDRSANMGSGSRKRMKESYQFPLYAVVPNSAWPAIDYMAKDGSYAESAYQNDPNRGLGDPFTISKQRFIFHPHLLTRPLKGDMHQYVLLEHATKAKDLAEPKNDFTPLKLPTRILPGAAGWSPYGEQLDTSKYFFISGGCDPDSKWCKYDLAVDLNVPRHPWGSAQEPRCWGFTVEQMAALDFDKMDLSKWIDSLELDEHVDMTPEATKAMNENFMNSADAFYSRFKNNKSGPKPTPGSKALVLSNDSLPNVRNNDFSAYTLQIAVPANWPYWFNDQPNNNPVTNVWVDWGDGSAHEQLVMHTEGRAWVMEHDYGDADPGRYKLSVTLDTQNNGPQHLTASVSVIPDQGKLPERAKLDFNNPGTVGESTDNYTPADTPSGMNQAPENLETVAPAMPDQFDRQGDGVTKPPATTTQGNP